MEAIDCSSVRQRSELETGLNTKEAYEADREQEKLISASQNNQRIFVVGNFCSGTRWLNYLIIKNTPSGSIYSLRHQHQYLDDNGNIMEHFKHGH